MGERKQQRSNNDDRTHSSSTCLTSASTFYLHNGIGNSTMMASAAAAAMTKTTITRHRLSVVIPVLSSLSFVDLLKQGEWREAFSRLETNPALAKEWHYDVIDDDGNIIVYHHNHTHEIETT